MTSGQLSCGQQLDAGTGRMSEHYCEVVGWVVFVLGVVD